MAKVPKRKVQSNLRRCPLLKITKKEFVRDEAGQVVGEETTEEFADCYKQFCMAWCNTKKACTYFDTSVTEGEAATGEETE